MDNQQKSFCPNCGAEVEGGARFCVMCGSALEEKKPVEPVAEPAVEQAEPEVQAEPVAEPQPTYNYYQEPGAQPKAPVSKKNSIISMVFGLVALELGAMAFMPIYAFIFFPVALVFAILGMKKSGQYTTEAGEPNVFSRIGKITSIISIPLSAVFGLVGLILTIALFA